MSEEKRILNCRDFRKNIVPENFRGRNYAFIIYPESAPVNWYDMLVDMHVALFVSPLHDRDRVKDTDVLKKAHFHVQLMLDGNKSPVQIRRMIEGLTTVDFEVVESKVAYARYLCHLDADPQLEPHKFHYQPKDVLQLGGADYMFTIDEGINKKEIFDEIREFLSFYPCILDFEVLSEYCRLYKPSWDYFLYTNKDGVLRILQSRAWRYREESDERTNKLKDKLREQKQFCLSHKIHIG